MTYQTLTYVLFSLLTWLVIGHATLTHIPNWFRKLQRRYPEVKPFMPSTDVFSALNSMDKKGKLLTCIMLPPVGIMIAVCELFWFLKPRDK